MADSEPADKPTGRKKIAAIALLGLTVIAGGAGTLTPFVFANKTEAAASPDSVKEAAGKVHLSHLEIGRIAVNLRPVTGNRDGARHLVIDTILAYDPAASSGDSSADAPGDGHGEAKSGTGGFGEKQPYIRDAFIEYLSNLTEQEVSGSSGMARMRTELLRRARAVAGNDAPQALLIQDYILQ